MEQHHSKQNDSEDRKELRHEPVPGYKMAFYIVVTLAVIYLGYIFMYTATVIE